MEQASGGGFFDEVVYKAYKIGMGIASEVNQALCDHKKAFRTGKTRFRPFCIHDIPQYEKTCPDCGFTFWEED